MSSVQDVVQAIDQVVAAKRRNEPGRGDVALPRGWGEVRMSSEDFAEERRVAISGARMELGRARSAIGFALLHMGRAARAGWLSLMRRAPRFHPEVPFSRVAKILIRCGCDSRDPTRCTGGFDGSISDQHGWCACSMCHRNGAEK